MVPDRRHAPASARQAEARVRLGSPIVMKGMVRMSFSKFLPALAGVVIVAGAAAPAAAQSPGSSGDDSMFVAKASSGGLAEVKLGTMASQKAAAPSVKRFGQRMVTDHGKANKQLLAAARQAGFTPKTTMLPEQKAMADSLSAQSGKAFDQAYMTAMLKDHREDVELFRQESQSGSSPQLKAFAAQTLPVLEQHLSLAQEAAAKVGADTSASGTR
jgi:putative membrane protein